MWCKEVYIGKHEHNVQNTWWAHLGAEQKEVGKEGNRTQIKEKRMKYAIIHKFRRSVFGQSLADFQRLTTNNNKLM